MSVQPDPKFQAPAPPSTRFWLRVQQSKTAWAPAPQPRKILQIYSLASYCKKWNAQYHHFWDWMEWKL